MKKEYIYIIVALIVGYVLFTSSKSSNGIKRLIKKDAPIREINNDDVKEAIQEIEKEKYKSFIPLADSTQEIVQTNVPINEGELVTIPLDNVIDKPIIRNLNKNERDSLNIAGLKDNVIPFAQFKGFTFPKFNPTTIGTRARILAYEKALKNNSPVRVKNNSPVRVLNMH